MVQGRQRERSTKAVPMRMGPWAAKIAGAPLFFKAQRTDGRSGADLAAGNAVGLAAAHADPVVDRRGPQFLYPGLEIMRAG